MTTANAERWKANTKARRDRLYASGGRNVAITLPADTAKLLDELLAYRRKKDPTFSILDLLSMLLVRDHKDMTRLMQRVRGKSGVRSTGPSTP